MSKEQTPITAEELKKTILKKLSQIFRGKTIYMAEIEDDIEQYAQAKVLEREKYLKNMLFRAYCKPFTDDQNRIEEGMAIALLARFDKYYETEVKPKYE